MRCVRNAREPRSFLAQRRAQLFMQARPIPIIDCLSISSIPRGLKASLADKSNAVLYGPAGPIVPRVAARSAVRGHE